MKKIGLIFLFVSSLFTLSNCDSGIDEKGTPEYISKIREWQNKRIENLKKENGWLNLAGLFWLKEGENKFGSDKSNDVIFPEGKAPAFIGSLILLNSEVVVKIIEGVEVKSNGTVVTELKLKNDMEGETVLEYGSLRWFIIKRGDKFGIRLRDLDSDLLKSFKGIERYPINSDWRFEAQLESYPVSKRVEIPNVLGQLDTADVSAALTFEKGGVIYKIDPLDAGKNYFILFADETSGTETYGSGRFLYVEKADSLGKIFIDFNKAYNPPCAFTKYATCPLPPKQNHLKMKVTAGEKNFHASEE
ncbi:MAG: DUF1684 domain-containing protein [Melioribacteraceae bacterium]